MGIWAPDDHNSDDDFLVDENGEPCEKKRWIALATFAFVIAPLVFYYLYSGYQKASTATLRWYGNSEGCQFSLDGKPTQLPITLKNYFAIPQKISITNCNSGVSSEIKMTLATGDFLFDPGRQEVHRHSEPRRKAPLNNPNHIPIDCLQGVKGKDCAITRFSEL